ncbi:MAG: NusG domain II-containing protein [Clostridiales bacterium]|nr:NusG domain II-containing protein [Clostridiales bacterium]
MKKRDILIIGALLLTALALYLFAQASLGGEASTVVVTVDGEVVLRKPLAVNDTYEIRQEDGSVNVIVVENGSVYMKEANCRDGLCIHQGKMRNAAKTIVCLPHKLTVSLTGEPIDTQNDDLDVIIS